MRASAPAAPVRQSARAYLMMEALVYLGVVFVVLGAGFVAMYRCVDNFIVLQRNADDISVALNAGERWRADVRSADGELRLETVDDLPVLRMQAGQKQLAYRYSPGALYRRVDSGPWQRVLDRVKACSFEPDRRPNVAAWRCELELEPRVKGVVKAGRVCPLFTFLAAPQPSHNP